jgi:two-component system response regulator
MIEPELLLIEDNTDDIELAQRALKRSRVKARLHVARSGPEAWDWLHQQGPDDQPKAVFLDLNMPEWSGFEMLERLRAQHSTRSLPVVILTTSKEPADIERSYELGANSYVTKPVDFLEFTDVFAKMTGYWIGVNEVRG